MIPSLSDFGTHDKSLYPHLWDRCFFAFAPGLGNSSNKAIDWATGTASVFTNFSAARWGYDSGIPYLEGGANDSTNTRARFNWQSSNNPISLAAWVYWTGQATNAMPLTVGGTDAYLRVTTGTSIPDFTVNNGNGRATGVTAVSVNGWTHLCGVRNSSELRLYVNGVLDKTTAYSAGTVSATDVIGVYSLQDATTSNWFAGRLDDAFAWSRALSVEEIELLASQRNIAFTRRASRSMRVAWPSDAATAITGTVAVTLAAATASASGTQTISGTSSSTLAAATSTASGSLTHSGTGAATLAAATSTASGTQTYSGTAAATLAGATANASGTQTCSGTAAATLAAATCDASGTQGTGTLGTVAVTLAAATSTASGSLAYSGTASATTGPATSTATGTQTCSGSAAAGTGAASCSASGSQTFSGTGSSSLANATATATGSVSGGPISGTVAVTLGAATATISGSVIGIAGPVFAVDCVAYGLRLEAAGETIRVQAETPRTATTVR